jgi:hypothetical protein
MKQVETGAQMKRRPGILSSGFPALVLGLGLALGAAGAQAGDVYWSLGMQSPGVVIGASNAAPMYLAPAPVVVYPAPRVMAPPVYGSAWAPPGHYKHKHHKRHWKHDHDRWDDGERYGYGRY